MSEGSVLFATPAQIQATFSTKMLKMWLFHFTRNLNAKIYALQILYGAFETSFGISVKFLS
jgi:hypothetical protein